MTLALRITPGGSVPIYQQITDQVRRVAAFGRVSPGDPLPSVRALAEQLVINPNTVAKAYAELVRDGVIESHAGRGYFFADRRQVYSAEERRRRLDDVVERLIGEVLTLQIPPEQVRAAVEQKLARLAARPQGSNR